MRHRKPANINLDLAKNQKAIVSDPAALKGHWIESLHRSASEMRLDLGCGKGAFLSQIALAHPDILFIGLDNNEVCVARAAQRLLENKVGNAFVVIADADNLNDLFSPTELSRIYLNFNSPFPAKKQADKRLTHADRLITYRSLLGPDGVLDLRTDHAPYWEFTLGQLEIAGYSVSERTDDLHARPLTFDCFDTEYDKLTSERGATIRALRATPGKDPKTALKQDRPLGLVSYLPEDLDTLTEIPYGMEDTIENLRNRKRNALEREKRHAHSVSEK